MVRSMNLRTTLLSAVALISIASTAHAGGINGWYVGLEGGANWIDDNKATFVFDDNAAAPALFEFDSGWSAFVTTGYGFGGLRIELEGGYRDNETTSHDAELTEWTVMANALYDLQVASKLRLTLGAGAGADFANLDITPAAFEDDQWNFAYQGIAGLSYALSKRLDLTLTYRYLRVVSPDFSDIGTDGETTALLSYHLDDLVKHSATVGLRYAFGVEEPPPPAPPPPPPPPPPPEPQIPREFIVFFGHNQADLTTEALEVVRQASEAAKQFGNAQISLVGHADRSGSNAYNDALSLKRAVNVKAALVKNGIADTAISVTAKGEEDPLVPTADGVREPQNRRVHISM